MADNMASAAYRERRRTRIFPIPIRTQDPSDNSPSGRPPVVNFSSPLIQKDRNRDRSLPRSSASSSYGRETTDSEDINMANWTPTAPSSAVTSDTNKHRSVDLLKAAWNVSTASTLSPYLSGHQGDHSSWDPTNTQGIPLPPKRYVGDEKAPEIPSDWPGIEDGLLTSVTLRDGRVAERDCASGHWKWRPDSVGSRMSGQTLNEKAYAKLTALEAEREPMPKLPFDLQTPRSQTPTPPVAPAPPASVFASTSTPHEIAFIVIVCLAQFLALAGLSQTVAPLPIIGNNFGITDPGTLSWYTAAFSLTVGTFILPAGRVGDMLGHKRIYVIGWLWYAVWSLITGFSFKSGSVVFTICRAFQGMGPAFLVPNAMALIGITFPMGKKRNIIFALFGSMGPTGFVAGSVFSSLLAETAWWPWAFFTLSILSFFIAAAAHLIIPAATKKSPATITGKFDFPGAVTGVAGLVLINFAFNQAPLVGWNDLYIPILLVVGIATMALFIFIELSVAESPLIPLRGLSKEGAFALACIAAGWGSHGIWLYYFFLFAEKLRGYTPLAAAAQLSPVAITGVVFALSTGLLVKKVKVAWIMFMAMLGFLVGLIFLATAPISQTYWGLTFISVLITPLGMNLSFPSGTILLSNAMPREHQGVAASLISTMVNYSISTGLGIAGTIDRYVTANAVHKGLTEQETLLKGYRGAWYFGMALDVLGLVLSGWFIWRSRERRV